MPKSKKFDRKKAVTFQLVHRSQQDPLIADENAPQRVLLPVQGQDKEKEKLKRIEEQHKYGIFYNDDEDYLQHLKDPDDRRVEWPDNVDKQLQERKERQERIKAKLPKDVFASEKEEEVGMLNKAMPVSGPQLHLDPELVAAMDEDFDFEDPDNQLEDNFIELADGVASDQEFDEEFDPEFDERDEDDYMSSDFDEERDEVGSLGSGKTFGEEETKSRFTHYSMTSSVMRRNEQLTLLDDRFEKMYADYDDNELGALDCEEIEGHVPETSDILLQYAKEFEESQRKEHLSESTIKDKIKERLENGEDSDSEEELVKMLVKEKEKWDCESILSTYSNIYNHPKLISEPRNNKIKINSKTGIPMDVIDSNKLTTKALNKLNEENVGYDSLGPKSMGAQSVISQLSILSIRPKDESPEERRGRKKLLKEYRKERRLEKKINTQAFKEETKRQVKIAINNKNNVQGNKIL